MVNKRIEKLVQDLVDEIGERKLMAALSDIRSNENERTLTIVANEGIHVIPRKIRRGEIFSVTTGNFNTSSLKSLKRTFQDALIKLVQKLKSSEWDRIYLIPFGHVTMSMQIKLLVYRVTGMDTIDLFHLGSGKYVDFELNQREIIVKSLSESQKKK